MISKDEAPIWFDYLEYTETLEPYLREDAPQDVKKAYEDHLNALANATERGELIPK